MVLLFYMLSLGIFFIFCSLRKKLSMSTYGSADLRIEILNDRNGSYIKKDTLFNNLHDFWTRFHDPNKCCFWWYPHVLWKLEMNIRKKWSPNLPKVNIIFKKYKEKDAFFDPRKFLEQFDAKKYFELLMGWKIKNEKKYLEENPYLNFGPYRHKKILAKPRPTIRG